MCYSSYSWLPGNVVIIRDSHINTDGTGECACDPCFFFQAEVALRAKREGFVGAGKEGWTSGDSPTSPTSGLGLLGKLFDLGQPQFPHLYNGDNSTCLSGVVRNL